MSKLSSFIYVAAMNQTDNGKGGQITTLINPLNCIVLPGLPSAFSFIASFGLTDLDSNDEVKFEMHDPEGKTVNTSEVSELLKTASKGANIKGVQINIDLRNLMLNEEGTYESKVFINGKEEGIFPILVMKVKSEK